MDDLASEAMFQGKESLMSADVAASLMHMLTDGDRVDTVRAALVCMELAFKAREDNSTPHSLYKKSHDHQECRRRGNPASADTPVRVTRGYPATTRVRCFTLRAA